MVSEGDEDGEGGLLQGYCVGVDVVGGRGVGEWVVSDV